MSIRFRRRIKLGKGLRLNLSKGGLGIATGGRGARIGIGPRGAYTSAGLPGTGLYAINYLGKGKREKRGQEVQVQEEMPKALAAGSTGRAILLIAAIISFFFNVTLGFLLLLLFIGILIYRRRSPRGMAAAAFSQGQDLFEKGKYSEALEYFEKARNLEPHIREILLPVGDVRLKTGDIAGARQAFEGYLAGGYDAGVAIKLALACMEDDDFQTAVETLQNLPQELKEQVEIINLGATCFLRMGKPELALEVLRKGPTRRRKMDSSLMEFRYLLGLAYKEMGQKKRALNQFQRVYAEDINYADIEEQMEELKD